MPLTRHRWPFTARLVADAPDSAGVFALWQDKELIYIGHAKGPGGLAKVLKDHLEGQHSCTRAATHYTWEIAMAPEERERQVLADYYQERKAFPRCNRREA